MWRHLLVLEEIIVPSLIWGCVRRHIESIAVQQGVGWTSRHIGFCHSVCSWSRRWWKHQLRNFFSVRATERVEGYSARNQTTGYWLVLRTWGRTGQLYMHQNEVIPAPHCTLLLPHSEEGASGEYHAIPLTIELPTFHYTVADALKYVDGKNIFEEWRKAITDTKDVRQMWLEEGWAFRWALLGDNWHNMWYYHGSTRGNNKWRWCRL